jgi:hypothetical protein
VSVSNRIVDTVHRAFQKHYVDGESPQDIWVVFIEAPAQRNGHSVRVHYARELAEATGLNPGFFQYEFVFEWGIPEDHVLHKVSLKTLMNRGLRVNPKDWSTKQLRASMAREFERCSSYGDELGITLGLFAQKFGARAPLEWIAYQWYDDCVEARFDSSSDTVELYYAHGRSHTVWADFFSDLEQGIDIALLDWWLEDSDYVRDFEEFENWKEMMEDGMNWDGIDILELWHGEELEDDWTPWDLLWAKNKDIEEEIEAEAVRIGL